MALMHKPPVRFWVGVMIFFGAYVNFSMRSNLSISIISMTKTKHKFTPECKKDINSSVEDEHDYFPNYGPRYDWTQAVQGNILGSYYYGYIIAALPSGPVSELAGPRPVIMWMTLACAVLNSLCVPAAWVHYWLLITLRFLIGLLGTFTYPALQVLIARWAPPLEKGKFTAGLMGSSLATVVNWPLISSCTVHFGWDWGFHVVSLLLVVYCFVFWFLVSDSPEQHKFISEEEVEYIKTCQAGSVSRKKHPPPIWKILKNKPFWVLAFSNFGSLWGLYLQLKSVPKYLAEVIGYDLENTGALAMLPQLFRCAVGLIAASITDWLQKKGLATSKGIRRSFVFFSHFLPGVMLIGIVYCGCNAAAVIVLLVVSLGCNGTCVLTNLVNSQDLSPNFAGTIFGLICFLAGFAGFIVPQITALCIKDHNGIIQWGFNFYIGGLIYLFSGVLFILFASVEEQEWNRVADKE